jgi:uncharacterized protein YegP (UPF0339 family)
MTGRRIELYINADNEFQFRFVADNHKIIAFGESYGKKDDALDTIKEYFPEWHVQDGTGV